MTYRTKVSVDKETRDRWRKLLSFQEIDDMTEEEKEELGAKTDDFEGGFTAEFEDGSHINIDLASGTGNYYDSVCWYDKEDWTREIVFDCAYEDIMSLDAPEEYIVDDNTYLIEWVLEDTTQEKAEEKPITKERVALNYRNGNITLATAGECQAVGGIVACIGDGWFFFGGETADKYDDAEAYKRDIPEDTIIDEIYKALDESIYEIDEDEYAYYDNWLDLVA